MEAIEYFAAGNQSEFANKVGKSQSQIADMLAGRKSFGEKVARDIERKLNLPDGAFDRSTPFTAPDLQINELRRTNLARIIVSGFHSDLDAFCKQVGRPPSQIIAMIKGSRALGESVAREIEQAIGFPKWDLDEVHSTENTLEEDIATLVEAHKNMGREVGARVQYATYLDLENRDIPKTPPNPDWLGTGEHPTLTPNVVTEPRPIVAFDDSDPLDADEVAVPRLTLKLSAGSGRLNWEIDEKGTPNRFRRSWCDKKGVKPSDLVTVMVDGESMYPTLPNGASVTINTAAISIRNGRVHAVDYLGEFYIKRLLRQPDHTVTMRSDNPDKVRFPDVEIPEAHADSLRVLGAVISVSADVD